jgi:tRNA threonylcarbamoyladenosine biosynthesis protein TsaB
MLLLAADTSGKHGSIALARAEDKPAQSSRVQVIEVVALLGGTFSAQLVPQIAGVLAKHGFAKDDVGGFVVASGPGSFTGLRVGLAAIKALAEILCKPIAAVSLLEVIALASGLQGNVTALLDAGRDELYVGEYDVAVHSVKVVAERLFRREEVWVSKRSKLVTADEALAKEARNAGVSILTIEAVNAGTLARIGWRKLRAGGSVTPEELEANYIRRPDAEIFAKKGS